ncbi:MAG: hypothetical protein HC828_04060 [Blastochloris sp.]|nr:hypothetical protein [Blastochloris sp.]
MTPTWLLLTTLVAPDALPAEPLAVSCRLQAGAAWNDGPEDVSALRCGGVDGFFVPSLVYRQLRRPQESEAYRLLDQELQLAKAELHERTQESLAAGRVAESSRQLADRCWAGWEQSADGLAKGYEALAAGQKSLADERAEDGSSPVLWFGVGVAVGVLAILAGAIALEKVSGP